MLRKASFGSMSAMRRVVPVASARLPTGHGGRPALAVSVCCCGRNPMAGAGMRDVGASRRDFTSGCGVEASAGGGSRRGRISIAKFVRPSASADKNSGDSVGGRSHHKKDKGRGKAKGGDNATYTRLRRELQGWNDCGGQRSDQVVSVLASSRSARDVITRLAATHAGDNAVSMTPAQYLVAVEHTKLLLGSHRPTAALRTQIVKLFSAFPCAADHAGDSARVGGAAVAASVTTAHPAQAKGLLRVLSRLLVVLGSMGIDAPAVLQPLYTAFGRGLQACGDATPATYPDGTTGHGARTTAEVTRAPAWDPRWLDHLAHSVVGATQSGVRLPASVVTAVTEWPWVLDPMTWRAFMRVLPEESATRLAYNIATCLLDTTFQGSHKRGKTFLDLQPRRQDDDGMLSFRDVWCIVDVFSHPHSVFSPRPWLGLSADDVAALWAWVNEAGTAALSSGLWSVGSKGTSGDASSPVGGLNYALSTREGFFQTEDPVLPRGMAPCMHLFAEAVAADFEADATSLSPDAARFVLAAVTAFWPGAWHPLVPLLERSANDLVGTLPPEQLRQHCRAMVLAGYPMQEFLLAMNSVLGEWLEGLGHDLRVVRHCVAALDEAARATLPRENRAFAVQMADVTAPASTTPADQGHVPLVDTSDLTLSEEMLLVTRETVRDVAAAVVAPASSDAGRDAEPEADDLVELAIASASLHVPWSGVLTQLCAQLDGGHEALLWDGRQTTALVDGLSRLSRVHVPSNALLHQLEHRALIEPSLEGSGQLHVAWRLAMLDYAPRKLLARIMSDEFISEWATDAHAHSHNLHLLKNVFLLVSAMDAPPAGLDLDPKFSAHVDTALRSAQPVVPQPRAAHVALSHQFRANGLDHVLGHVVVPGVYVDVAFPEQAVAVDVVSPLSFEPGTNRLNYRSLAKRRLLKQLDWTVVRLASDEVWDLLTASDKRQQQLLRNSMGLDAVPATFIDQPPGDGGGTFVGDEAVASEAEDSDGKEYFM